MFQPNTSSLFGPNIQFLKLFGILPHINFKTNRLSKNKWGLVQIILLLFFIVNMEVYIWIHKFYMEYSEESYLPVIVRVSCELAGFTMFVCVVVWSYTKRELWEKLFRQLQFVYNEQIVRENNERKQTLLRKANLSFLVITFLILVLYSMDIFFWQIENQSYNFILSYVYFYYNFLLSNLIGQVALEISYQYKYLNNALVATEYTNLENCRKILLQTRKLYVEMDKVVETFNKLFGKILLLMAVQCSLQILDFGVFLVEKVLPNLKFEYDALVIYVLFIILDLFWFSVTQTRCDEAKRESLHLLSCCYNLPELPDTQKDLRGLIEQLKNRPVQFTAGGFFEIKRSTTFSIVGTTATYFIVYVELRNNGSSWATAANVSFK